jgi:uncharacterized repeat protein (TIGR04052 family)
MNRASARAAITVAACLALLNGCAEDEANGDGLTPITLRFAAKVGDAPFSCDGSFEGIGTTKSTLKPLDFRMYVHDVRLVRADGSEAALSLEQDGQWQRDDIAFLDFEDGGGTCETGSPETRTEIRGEAPAGDYVGVKFILGIPAEDNHLDAATAPAPFNIPGMWWSWKGGYKFVRMDFITTANPAYRFHLGATECEGTTTEGFSCLRANNIEIGLNGFDPRASTVVFDVASFYSSSDLDLQRDPETDNVSGCMAFEGDPECPAVFTALGWDLEGERPASAPQKAFRVE